ncbi:MAG: ribosome silencing factor [Veillonellaceae bacterium]|jgi:ribosome-associated protein|nr:ribosome silencing factor [Veillonellaceae bacterium]
MTELASDMPQLIAAAASDKKAFDIQILDMKKVTLVTDYFIICSGNTTTQVKAIADNIDEKLAEQGIKMLHKEGYNEARWILLDFGTCVVHVFVDEERRFYNIERLWSEAKAQLYSE